MVVVAYVESTRASEIERGTQFSNSDSVVEGDVFVRGNFA